MFRDVLLGEIEEDTSKMSVVDKEGGGSIIFGWGEAVVGGVSFQVSVKYSIKVRQLIYSNTYKPINGRGVMVGVYNDPVEVRIIYGNICHVIPRGITVNPIIWFRNIGSNYDCYFGIIRISFWV